MSDCIYCGNPAGFLRKKHKDCEKIYQEGNNNLLKLISSYIKNDEQLENFQNNLNTISNSSYISEINKNKILLMGVKIEISNLVDNNIFDLDQLKKLFDLIYKFDLIIELNDNIIYKNLVAFISENIANKLSKDIFIEGIPKIEEYLNNIADPIRLDSAFKNGALLMSLERAIYLALEDGIINENEEKSIVGFIDYFKLTTDILSKNEAYQKLVKSIIIRDILNGILPKRINVKDQIPFVLQKNESLIWLINNVDYYEDRVKRQYVGGSQGASIRIAKGLYYRMGAFKGQAVDTVEKTYLGKGILAFTNKQLFFVNNNKSFRIRYDKIISIIPSENGFTILKDGVTAKPQSFIDGDGWFSYNMITNLSQLDLK